MDGGPDSQLMNYLVRMVVPMKREFGSRLDVSQFLHDVAYARGVMDQALSSQDPRLREYAGYVQQCYHGPRHGAAAPPSAPKQVVPGGMAPVAKVRAVAPPATMSAEEAEEAELRAKMLKKYTDGLR